MGAMGSPTVRGIIQPFTWHVGVARFHYFMHRLSPFPWQYQPYTTLCMCAWVRLRIFPFPLSFSSLLFVFFSPILSFFFSVSLLSSLSLARAVPSSFYPPCFSLFSSNYLSHLLLSFPLYTCVYTINADIRTWHLAPFHLTVLLFDRSRTASRWWWASYIVLLVTMVQWALLQIRVKISN